MSEDPECDGETNDNSEGGRMGQWAHTLKLIMMMMQTELQIVHDFCTEINYHEIRRLAQC
jgi:hypothetical protein